MVGASVPLTVMLVVTHTDGPAASAGAAVPAKDATRAVAIMIFFSTTTSRLVIGPAPINQFNEVRAETSRADQKQPPSWYSWIMTGQEETCGAVYPGRMRSPRGQCGPLSTVWPQVAHDLTAGLLALDESALAAQVPALRMRSWHGCGDNFCHSFSTLLKRQLPEAGVWTSIPLEHATVSGIMVVDVVDRLIGHVEIVH